jgi:hypothetical protein
LIFVTLGTRWWTAISIPTWWAIPEVAARPIAPIATTGTGTTRAISIRTRGAIPKIAAGRWTAVAIPTRWPIPEVAARTVIITALAALRTVLPFAARRTISKVAARRAIIPIPIRTRGAIPKIAAGRWAAVAIPTRGAIPEVAARTVIITALWTVSPFAAAVIVAARRTVSEIAARRPVVAIPIRTRWPIPKITTWWAAVAIPTRGAISKIAARAVIITTLWTVSPFGAILSITTRGTVSKVAARWPIVAIPIRTRWPIPEITTWWAIIAIPKVAARTVIIATFAPFGTILSLAARWTIIPIPIGAVRTASAFYKIAAGAISTISEVPTRTLGTVISAEARAFGFPISAFKGGGIVVFVDRSPQPIQTIIVRERLTLTRRAGMSILIIVVFTLSAAGRHHVRAARLLERRPRELLQRFDLVGIQIAPFAGA